VRKQHGLDAAMTGQQVTPSAHEAPRRILVNAFDDASFKEKADKLLNRHHEEDIAAKDSVISTPGSTPTRCSVFHNVIQKKIAALRAGYKGGKR
jgi:hypothetical protein